MDFNIENDLRPGMRQGERLIWTGRPRTGIRLQAADAFVIPFSLLWCGFIAFWEFMAYSMGAPLIFALFGIPFILIGIYLLVGRFILDAKRRAKTIYGITPERIIIRSGIFNQNFQSLNIKALSEITLTEMSDGSGTINLGPRENGNAKTPIRYVPGTKQGASLEMIEDVKSVYDKIIELQMQKS